MQPKNNRNLFSDNPNVQPSTSNGNQQFRPSISASANPFSYNSNLVVTQQQQPTRINNTFQLNAQNNSVNQLEVTKRLVAAMQPQNSPMHLINRPSQSPIQMNQNQSSQILMDRSQMIRLPQTSQADSASINNIYQALYIIQQNLLQNDKNKQSQNHVPEVCRPVVSTIHNSPVQNNHSQSNNLTAISINSASHNQNATVLAMSNADFQLFEAIGRLNSQQGSKSHTNVSLIQSDSPVAQQLLTALQKQSPRTSTSVNNPGIMVIGQTSKPNQGTTIQNKDQINISSTFSNNNDLSNPLVLKMPTSSKTDIPVWTKLLDTLSNNPENLSEVNRSCKMRDMEDNQRKILSQPRLSSNNIKCHPTEYGQRNEMISGINSLKSSPTISKSINNNDTHQILIDNKALSYLVSSPNNVSTNNDDMIDLHFEKSLNKIDVKKSHNHGSTFNYKPYESNNGNHTKNNIIKGNNRTTSYCSFIDLERPDSGHKISVDNVSRVSTPNEPVAGISSNINQITIKEKADAMVENLLIRSLNNNYSTTKHNQTGFIANAATHCHVKTELSSRNSGSNKVCQSIINTHTDNTVIKPRDSLINSTSMLVEDQMKMSNYVNNRPNPSKNDLPLKKRIMLDFNENGDDNIPEKIFIAIKPENDAEKNHPNEEKPVKIRRKRVHTDSMNSDSKTDSSSHDPSLPTTKRRGRIPGTGKNQKLKEESRLKEINRINMAGNEETWQELTRTIIKPPDIESISAKTLTPLDLEPLKLSKKEFFQIGSCTEIAPKMVKCRSCRQNNSSVVNSNSAETTASVIDDESSVKSGSKDSNATTVVSSFCRFHGFRKLQFNAKGTLTQAGFCKSNEADGQDLSLWRMYQPLPSELSVSIATYLVKSLSPVFCEIIDTENKFLQETYETLDDSDNGASIIKRVHTNIYGTGNKSEFVGFVWKRPVQGVREMCDVCETSIFNSHWVCRKCGYSICVDCFNERNDTQITTGIASPSPFLQQEQKERENDPFQIKTSNSIKNAVHLNTRGASKNRYFSCNHPWAVCTANRQQHCPDQLLKVELIPIRVINELRNRMHTVSKLLQIKLNCNCLSKSKTESDVKLLKQLSVESSPGMEADNMSAGNYDLHMLADIALKEVVSADGKSSAAGDANDRQNRVGIPRPPPVLSPPHHPENGNYSHCNNQESKQADGDGTVYSWIRVASNFKMIHLHNAQSSENLKLFQQEWLQAHPVLVSGCHETMDLMLWTPEKFLEEFESEPALLVDCETGFPVPRATMKSFWEGFSCVEKRISSSEGSSKPACLKLKDWPPSDDFNDVLPQRCKDILSNLPIKEYTGRQGEFNLAAHLPEFFVCPDLGPKLYNAYGMPRESKLGTTNLHLDIADAVNVMLYVGIPSDHMERETQNALDSMREAMVDESVIRRADHELPGALWHIFLPKDVPKLRQFLIAVLSERGESIGVNQDPIHDQQFYLSQPLLDRLKAETNVEGCAIIQFRGDAVFIPAGSPHQVRNLHSCMKVANDFVSPENILNCLLVTKEFRQLSATHANHEDKLQAKNMIFHAIKDAVSTLIVNNSHVSSEINVKQRDGQVQKRIRYNQQVYEQTWASSDKDQQLKTSVAGGTI